ncbi:hypothetical protein OAL85_04730 [Methylophilaceae bacterium]|nr:hypothetical protein [Methylophilaceae bacterium]
MKKRYSLYLFVSLVSLTNISSGTEEYSDDYLLRKNPFLPATNCQEVKSIEGVDYCVQKSSITLNSCGRTSDWPCMDELGCLKIDKLTTN